MKTLNDLRKQLKPLGYNVKTTTLSWGKHATYFRLSDKRELPSLFTGETLQEWQPLLDWKRAHNCELKHLKETSEICGLL